MGGKAGQYLRAGSIAGRGVFFLQNGGFDLFPQLIRRLDGGQQLAGGLGDGLDVGQQGAAKGATGQMGVGR